MIFSELLLLWRLDPARPLGTKFREMIMTDQGRTDRWTDQLRLNNSAILNVEVKEVWLDMMGCILDQQHTLICS